MKKLLIISYSDIRNDARVLRQIKCLKETYKLAVAGFGGSPFINEIEFVNIGFYWDRKYIDNIDRVRLLFSSFLSENFFYNISFIKKIANIILKFCEKFRPHLVICNDWNTLPLGFYIKNKYNSKIIYDSHEFAQKQYEGDLRLNLMTPLIKKIEDKYIPKVDSFITVNNSIAKIYEINYGIKPIVIRNMPYYKKSKFKEAERPLRLVHHGGAGKSRRLENIIKAMKYLNNDYELHFYLVGDPTYISRLKKLASKIGKIFFHNPVSQNKIIETLERYDIGLTYYYPTNTNNYLSLPNKFFDFIMAGLCLVSPPLPEQIKIINNFKLGVISKGFNPESLAKVIGNLSIEDVNKFKKNSLKTAKILNAENELKKLTTCIENLLI